MAVVAAVLVGIAVLTALAVVMSMTDSPMSRDPVDRADPGLPDRPLTAEDIGALRFRVGLRGYRMDDVDAALARIQHQLAAPDDAETPVGRSPSGRGKRPSVPPAPDESASQAVANDEPST